MRITKPSRSDRVDLDAIDLYDPSVFCDGDPHAIWQTLRAEEPVFWQQLPDGRGFWSVTKHDDCCRVLGDYLEFTSEQGAILKMLAKPDPAGGHQMAVSDPPRHTQIRAPLHEMMTRAALLPLVPRLRAAIERLLAPMMEEPIWDLGAAMTALPMIVSGALMGLPEEEYDDLVRWGMMTVAPDDEEFQVGGDPELTVHEAHHDLFAYFARHVRRRRRANGSGDSPTDLLGQLLSLKVDGARLGEGDVVSNCYSLLLGANVNTGHVVTAAILELLEDPDQYSRWAKDPACLRTGIREALRWSSPVVHFMRYAVDDVTVRGTKIRKGDAVVAWIASANRDEEMFEEPFRFDVERHPNKEIAFGAGPHRCIGASAALLTLELTLRELFAKVERFEQVSPPGHLRSNFTGGIKHLQVTAHPR